MTEGIICNLKRFAVHDGPGVRTTLFLKGCPLRCLWCHNPESTRQSPELGIRFHKCTACGECARFCSRHRIEDGKHFFDRSACTACGKCVDTCPFDVLVRYGQRLTPSEALTLLCEDRIFYDESGGGVTISGGEPLLQADFCRELCGLLKEQDIHTAIDTCGHVPWTAFEKVLPFTDLFLYDFKHIDSTRHRELTGCGNELIKENLCRLSQTGKPVEIRMIMLPGLNMSEDDLTAAAVFLSTLPNILRIRLLPYHALSSSKYEALGLHYAMPDIKTPTPDELASAATLIRQKTKMTVEF